MKDNCYDHQEKSGVKDSHARQHAALEELVVPKQPLEVSTHELSGNPPQLENQKQSDLQRHEEELQLSDIASLVTACFHLFQEGQGPATNSLMELWKLHLALPLVLPLVRQERTLIHQVHQVLVKVHQALPLIRWVLPVNRQAPSWTHRALGMHGRWPSAEATAKHHPRDAFLRTNNRLDMRLGKMLWGSLRLSWPVALLVSRTRSGPEVAMAQSWLAILQWSDVPASLVCRCWVVQLRRA